LAILLALGLVGCGSALPAATWDQPIPAAEKRATMRVLVDLEPVSDCDERFDLLMYEDRGVERIAWEENARGCSGRAARVRYVPGRIGRGALLERMKKFAKRVSVTEG
jgi:hypothetical protein